jgi:hypothetical protein
MDGHIYVLLGTGNSQVVRSLPIERKFGGTIKPALKNERPQGFRHAADRLIEEFDCKRE